MKRARLRPLPQAFITARAAAAGDPPALARNAVALADDEDGELGLAARFRLAVDVAEHGAELAHLRPREMIAELLEHLGISERRPGPGRGDEMGADFLRIGELSAINYRTAPPGRPYRRPGARAGWIRKRP